MLIVLTEGGAPARDTLLRIVATTFAISAVIAALGSRGRHLSWIAFTAIALLAWLAI